MYVLLHPGKKHFTIPSPAPAQWSISVKGGGGSSMILQLRSAWCKMPWPSECRGWVQCLRSVCAAEALDQKRLWNTRSGVAKFPTHFRNDFSSFLGCNVVVQYW